ncbi:MAG TPA: hypothetical protein VFI31_24295 [Pirellulales bacterium]|nr:hypothetical protein [Pirellulales bacterium]
MKRSGTAWQHLDFDNEVVGKPFDTLKHQRCSIGPPFDAWEDLKPKHDLAASPFGQRIS